MKANVQWADGMLFKGASDGHEVAMDAKSPLGKNSAMTPKELVALGMGGCTAMDVIALLKKYKQLPDSFNIEIEVTPTTGVQPAVFEKAIMKYVVTGNVVPEKLIEAVHLSQTKYCGVSAMLSKAFPIEFQIELNGAQIGTGFAEF